MDVLETVNQHCGNKGLKFREGETHIREALFARYFK